MQKQKNKLVEIRPEIAAAMRQNEITRGLIKAHGLAYVINRDLAEKYGAAIPLTKSESLANAQRERWQKHHAKIEAREASRVARNERKRQKRAKAKRIARKASVGSEAK